MLVWVIVVGVGVGVVIGVGVGVGCSVVGLGWVGCWFLCCFVSQTVFAKRNIVCETKHRLRNETPCVFSPPYVLWYGVYSHVWINIFRYVDNIHNFIYFLLLYGRMSKKFKIFYPINSKLNFLYW